MRSVRSKINLLAKSIVAFLVVACIMVVPNISRASTTLNPTLVFGITELRQADTNKWGYAIGDPTTNGSTGTAANIWNIIKYDSSSSTTYSEGNYYCVKAGVGFSNVVDKQEYNISYDMSTEKADVLALNTTLKSLESNYSKILAMADLLYLPGVDDEAAKIALLEAAGCDRVDGYDVYKLSDEQIEVVQQAALWYFTNMDESPKYDKTSNTSWLNYTTDGATYKPLSDYGIHDTEEGPILNDEAEALYKYLINTANTNGVESYVPTSKVTLYASTTNTTAQPIIDIDRQPEEQKPFDLALRKYITKINGTEVANTRVPNVDTTTLTDGTTATYKHRKDALAVSTGDVVTYNLTIYNEGEKAGRATKIVDQLPTGLEFKQINTQGFETSYSSDTNTLTITRAVANTDNLEAYNGTLAQETITVECTVTATPSSSKSTVLTNVAWIAEEYNAVDNTTITNQVGEDRDSEPATTPSVNKDNMSTYTGNNNKEELNDPTYFYKGQQDDDDFEKLVMLPGAFDLKLVKRITAINSQNVPERIEDIDVSKLNVIGSNGQLLAETADYKLTKDPILVSQNDIVTYTFRVYNEGYLDGYASEITEDLPEGLEFLYSDKTGDELKEDTTFTDAEKAAIEYNQNNLWHYTDATLKTISTNALAKASETTVGGNLIKAFGENDGTKTSNDLDYKEVSVMLKVISKDVTGTIIRNEAAITDDSDTDGEPVGDRDSDPSKWVKYEDDEDYDNIKLQSFDLALRKFIIATSHDETVEDTEYLKNEDGSYTRAPVVDTSKLNTTDDSGKMITTAQYNHTKTPIDVTINDTIIYMLRVYNEGEINGYAAEIKDHLPEYLEFVDSDFNKTYGWTLSEDGKTVTTTYLNNQLIKAAEKNEDGKYVLTYKEVPIMCKVTNKAKSNQKITNIADITLYQDEKKNEVNDRDSTQNNVDAAEGTKPEYKDDETGTYIPGQEDDDDFEKVTVKIFDLALRKWVTEAIVIEDGVTTVTPTGHDPWDEPEDIVKVELHRKKLASTTVKFRFSIRVYNQGDIAGYAKEVKDNIPEGLEMIPEENPQWVDEGNNVVVTRALENTLLQPGEYADVEMLLTWINDENNIGLQTNTAEISEDYNEPGIPDIDSVPDNGKPGEDDIDIAQVIVSISTGGGTIIYFGLGLTILVTIAGGVVLIRKYVL